MSFDLNNMSRDDYPITHKVVDTFTESTESFSESMDGKEGQAGAYLSAELERQRIVGRSLIDAIAELEWELVHLKKQAGETPA